MGGHERARPFITLRGQRRPDRSVETDRVTPLAAVVGHRDETARRRHPPPRLGGDPGLITQANHHCVVASLARGHHRQM